MENKKISPKYQENTQLDISILSQNASMNTNLNQKQIKKSYTQYISKFDTQIQYSKCKIPQLQNSLTQMRIILKQLNVMLNKMMDKNYQLLTQKSQSITTPSKQVQILKAQIENAKKIIITQDIQITNLSNTAYEMQSKQSYEQSLMDQIMEIKQKMPNVYLESKHNACDINRNGYVLVNQQQDNSQYMRVNILRSDLDRAYQRLKKSQEKFKSILQKQRQLEQKNYQINQVFDNIVQLAKDNAMEITVHGSIISLKQKYNNLLKKKQQEFKKNALLQHVSKNSEVILIKKIADMKKLLSQYNLKQEQIHKKLIGIQKQNAQILKKSNILQKLTQKSFSYRYAETLLKADKVQRVKNDKNKIYDDYEDDFDELENSRNLVQIKNARKQVSKQKEQMPTPYKPSLNLIRRKNELGQNKYEKSMSLVQIPAQKKDIRKQILNIDDQNRQKNTQKNEIFHVRRSSANQIIKKNQKKQLNFSVDKTPQSPNVKHWKNDNKEKNVNQEPKNQISDYKISKPIMNIKRKNQNISAIQLNQKNRESKKNAVKQAEDIQIQPKFSRLTKNKSNKVTDQYMTYLQEKGRKILGLS